VERKPRAPGERLFAAYLRQRGLSFDYEAPSGGANPDFTIHHASGDVIAEYPTVFVLMGLWPFQIARTIDWEDEDPAIVERMLRTVTPKRVLRRRFWPKLTALVLVQPDGDRLPTRASYDGGPVYTVGFLHPRSKPCGGILRAEGLRRRYHYDLCSPQLP
jgi:hypothetical protein